jgi:peptide/nickel transport system substrate-binding protein
MLLQVVPGGTPAWARDELVIGTTQFPPGLHPQTDGTLIRSYALGFVLRPITAFDKDWQKVCLLCTSFPLSKTAWRATKIVRTDSAA